MYLLVTEIYIINKNVNDVALIRHLATSNIANFMWYNFLLVKK